MEIVNSSPQAASPLPGRSSTLDAARREKVPSDGQKIPSNSEPKEAKQANEHEVEAETTQESLQKAVDNLNSQSNAFNRNLQFSVDSELDRTVIRVVDTETKQVIRQIPSEEVLSIARRADASASALLDVVA